MKKIWMVVALLGIVAVSFGVAGFVYANGQTPPTPERPYGPGMMDDYDGHDYDMMGDGHGFMSDGYGMMGSHMMGSHIMGSHIMGVHDGEGSMHEAMIETLAETLNVSVEELNTRHDAGETLWDIAGSEGLSEEDFRELMLSSHEAALKDAIDRGWLTQEQAEWMEKHMNEMWEGEIDSHCSSESSDIPDERW